MSVDRKDLRITAAAILYADTLWTGTRHVDIMRDIYDKFPDANITDDKQGFVANDGKFYNRFQSVAIAFGSGQTKDRKERLISDHIWGERR